MRLRSASRRSNSCLRRAIQLELDASRRNETQDVNHAAELKVRRQPGLPSQHTRTVLYSKDEDMGECDEENLARKFLRLVWAPPNDLDGMKDLMTKDYRMSTARHVAEEQCVFKEWACRMHATLKDVTNKHLELLSS